MGCLLHFDSYIQVIANFHTNDQMGHEAQANACLLRKVLRKMLVAHHVILLPLDLFSFWPVGIRATDITKIA